MLQKWKRKGKRFRHVEKDGEETTELSVKIRAAKFRDLPMSLRILIVNLSLFLILCAVFFMAGAYLYAPQAAGRNYVEACLAGDWNSAYDVCQFPDSTFLSRKNYVNAMTWKAKQDGSDGQETPEIKSFFMRRKQSLETGGNRIYTVRYTLKGVSDSQEETMEIAAGDIVKWNFKEWYVVPKDSYVTDVEITVPANASLYLDGVLVGKKYLKETADTVSVYKIPYLFIGGHTIELTEAKKDPYREIILVEDNSSMEFLPDLKLNDSTGKVIADRVEESLDKVFAAAVNGKAFSTIKDEFSADTAVQADAKEQYQQIRDAYLNSDTNTGITSVTISSISTTVTSVENQMKVETDVTATIEKRNRFLHFFRKTKTETITWKIESAVMLEKENWVMGSDFLKGVDLGK
ncbi:hypothetical protein [Fusicatenibacter sp.]